MEETLMKFNIQSYYDLSQNQFLIDNQEELEKSFKNFIDSVPTNLIIQNNADYKSLKKAKAQINNAIKGLAKDRITFTNKCVGATIDFIKDKETRLKEVSEKLAQSIEDYEVAFLGKQIEEKKSTLTIKSSNKEALEKVRILAVSLGLEVSIKE